MAKKRRTDIRRETAVEKAGSAVAQALDLPSDALTGGARLYLLSNRELTIEHHRGIIEYGDERILVSGGTMHISVEGKHLELRSFTPETLGIVGTIDAVRFLL